MSIVANTNKLQQLIIESCQSELYYNLRSVVQATIDDASEPVAVCTIQPNKLL